ncbi:hypothetical protein OXYTRIMIC_462 [Oxytricha trifallax]|uniref:Uncharacterized protein n=1 Tax=Oxytricha trifallax TaxID=1172189 RepID=A0A073IBM9_9SPIT|nr:hypothetical protein OXYTRIMIC_462 [Oxytricha trifallax]
MVVEMVQSAYSRCTPFLIGEKFSGSINTPYSLFGVYGQKSSLYMMPEQGTRGVFKETLQPFSQLKFSIGQWESQLVIQ